MFFGEYEHTLDGKSRFILPSRFRESFAKDTIPKFYMTRGFDTCLALYLEEDWHQEMGRLKKKSYMQGDVRKFQRLLYSRTTEVICDKQGRILIADKFKESAEISKNITLVGLDNKIEIWNRMSWQNFNNDNGDAFEQLAEALSEGTSGDKTSLVKELLNT
jgi:MraZ protein